MIISIVAFYEKKKNVIDAIHREMIKVSPLFRLTIFGKCVFIAGRVHLAPLSC